MHPKRASVSKNELKGILSKKYNVSDDKCIILFGFQVAFGTSFGVLFNALGGGRSSGFALIYDSIEDVKKFEARYRLARVLSHSENNPLSSESRSITVREERC